MKKLIWAFALTAIFIAPSGAALAAPKNQPQPRQDNPFYVTGQTGADVSYPNCSSSLSGTFGVVGVNNGIVYGVNSCLAKQASHYKDLSLYVNTGLNADPTSSTYYQKAQTGCNGDVLCAAYNYGYNAGTDALQTAQAAGVSSSRWWLDVETANTWNSDTLQNRQSLQGESDALKAGGAAMVGVYSTTSQWQSVSGNWQNGWFNWGASTWTSSSQAATYCTGHQFTGGQTLLIQFKSRSSSVDQDYAC